MLCVSKGDITLYSKDAIVNAGNETLCGCFTPNHACLDHQIHEKGGQQLTRECKSIMKGKMASPGDCILTLGGRLPCKFVIHAYGPNLNLHEFKGKKGLQKARYCLRKTYMSCLRLAHAKKLKSIAFPAISTGLYKFDPHEAAQIAIDTVIYFLRETGYPLRVDFIMFPENYCIYKKLLKKEKQK